MYRLFYLDKGCNVEKTKNSIKQVYGTEKALNVSGVEGTFLATIPDVYISGGVEAIIRKDRSFSEDIMDLLYRFFRDDYGLVDQDTKMDNTETRYLCGVFRNMFARYETQKGMVCLSVFDDNSLVYLEGEDISDFETSLADKKSRTQLFAEENARRYLKIEEEAEEENLAMLRQLVEEQKQSQES